MLAESTTTTAPARGRSPLARGHRRSTTFDGLLGRNNGRQGLAQVLNESHSRPPRRPVSLDAARPQAPKRSRSVQSRASSRNSSLGGGSKFERDYQKPKFVRGRAGSGSDYAITPAGPSFPPPPRRKDVLDSRKEPSTIETVTTSNAAASAEVADSGAAQSNWCSICNVTLNGPEEFKQHDCVRYRRLIFKCPICDLRLSSYGMLSRHLERPHQSPALSNKTNAPTTENHALESLKSMHAKALCMANAAIMLDQSSKTDDALEAYYEVCEWLQQIEDGTSDRGERRRLSIMRQKYLDRFAELCGSEWPSASLANEAVPQDLPAEGAATKAATTQESPEVTEAQEVHDALFLPRKEQIVDMLWSPRAAATSTQRVVTETIDSSEPVTCYICGVDVVIRTKRDWQMHVLMDLEPYQCLEPDCPQADWTYRSVPGLKRHYRRQHSSSAFLTTTKSCPFCNDSFNDRGLNYRLKHVCRHMQDIAFGAIPRPQIDWQFYSEIGSNSSIARDPKQAQLKPNAPRGASGDKATAVMRYIQVGAEDDSTTPMVNMRTVPSFPVTDTHNQITTTRAAAEDVPGQSSALPASDLGAPGPSVSNEDSLAVLPESAPNTTAKPPPTNSAAHVTPDLVQSRGDTGEIRQHSPQTSAAASSNPPWVPMPGRRIEIDHEGVFLRMIEASRINTSYLQSLAGTLKTPSAPSDPPQPVSTGDPAVKQQRSSSRRVSGAFASLSGLMKPVFNRQQKSPG